jgi:hypothetical protein
MVARGFPRCAAMRARGFQQGQALVYGLFVLIGGLAALFFLFNAGQLTREKTKLVNTSDAVAYSAGVMNARALNFDAYTNRAMVANTVAIAQLVSLSSWVQYAGNISTFGYDLDNPKFALFYPSYFAALESGMYLQESLNDTGMLEKLEQASDGIVQVLSGAQQVTYASLLPMRQAVMKQVADANYENDGTVVVESFTLPTSDFLTFVHSYSGDDRGRFAEVATTSANKDGFVKSRSWKFPGLWADCASAWPRVDWLDRRGGTNLVNFDQWEALDTLSEKRWHPRNWLDVFCSAIGEAPQSWGGNVAADDGSQAFDPSFYDKSIPVNPGSSGVGLVTSESWGYKGLPTFFDLSSSALGQDDPRLRFSVRLRRDKSQTVTSEGRSDIKPTPRLNTYAAKPAGGKELVAVSTAENYFQRDGDAKDNVYGSSIGKPQEIGSLFNPYWQVHLVRSDADIRRAQAMQGVVLP